MQGNLSVERMCVLAVVSRAGFYRSLHEREPDLEEMELRSAIQAIAIEHKLRYGYRRVTAELRHRGFLANHKRVVRLMRLDNLLALRRSAFVSTTDSDHELLVHLNLASRMQLSGINQLWVADITFVRLQQEFVYVAVLTSGARATRRRARASRSGRRNGTAGLARLYLAKSERDTARA